MNEMNRITWTFVSIELHTVSRNENEIYARRFTFMAHCCWIFVFHLLTDALLSASITSELFLTVEWAHVSNTDANWTMRLLILLFINCQFKAVERRPMFYSAHWTRVTRSEPKSDYWQPEIVVSEIYALQANNHVLIASTIENASNEFVFHFLKHCFVCACSECKEDKRIHWLRMYSTRSHLQ